MFKLILGIALAYFGFTGHNQYSAILFIQGMIMINSSISTIHFKKGSSLNYE